MITWSDCLVCIFRVRQIMRLIGIERLALMSELRIFTFAHGSCNATLVTTVMPGEGGHPDAR